MIILESEWDQAAGVAEQLVERREESIRSASQLSPSSAGTLDQQISIGSDSLTSLSRASGVSAHNASLVESTPASPTADTSSPEYRESLSNTSRSGPITYIFAPVEHSFNSMVVQSQNAMIPLYYIFVRMNCFIPSSHITTIRRGDTEYGEEVGHFEMGVSIRKPTVVINDTEKIVDTVLTRGGSRMARTWQWRFSSDQSKHLSWTFDSPIKYCYLGTKTIDDRATKLAAFTPPPLTPRADGRPSPTATLKVFPAGHRLFDHILISALILERRRLTPT